MIMVLRVNKKMKIYKNISKIKNILKVSILYSPILIKNHLLNQINQRTKSIETSQINMKRLKVLKRMKKLIIKKKFQKCLLIMAITTYLIMRKPSLDSNMRHIIRSKRSNMIIIRCNNLKGVKRISTRMLRKLN